MTVFADGMTLGRALSSRDRQLPEDRPPPYPGDPQLLFVNQGGWPRPPAVVDARENQSVNINFPSHLFFLTTSVAVLCIFSLKSPLM